MKRTKKAAFFVTMIAFVSALYSCNKQHAEVTEQRIAENRARAEEDRWRRDAQLVANRRYEKLKKEMEHGYFDSCAELGAIVVGVPWEFERDLQRPCSDIDPAPGMVCDNEGCYRSGLVKYKTMNHGDGYIERIPIGERIYETEAQKKAREREYGKKCNKRVNEEYWARKMALAHIKEDSGLSDREFHEVRAIGCLEEKLQDEVGHLEKFWSAVLSESPTGSSF